MERIEDNLIYIHVIQHDFIQLQVGVDIFALLIMKVWLK